MKVRLLAVLAVVAVGAMGATSPAIAKKAHSSAITTKHIGVTKGRTNILILQVCYAGTQTCGGWNWDDDPNGDVASVSKPRSTQSDTYGGLTIWYVKVRGLHVGHTQATASNANRNINVKIRVRSGGVTG